MPAETRTVIDLTDILGVEFECPECKAQITLPTQPKTPVEKLVNHCPNCRFLWFGEASGIPFDVSLVNQVVSVLQGLQRLDHEKIKARVRVHIKTDD
jgi:hypothetical protein